MTVLAALAWAAAALFTAPSHAATSTLPGVSTGSASHVHGTSALLSGRVNPHGLETTYFFEYGPTTAYGLHTATGNAGKGTVSIKVGLTATNLRAGYHYRLVATNKTGTARGRDRVFATKTTKLRFEVAPRVAPVTYGSSLLISARLCMASFFERRNLDLYLEAFRKVFRHRDEIVSYGRALDYREPWVLQPAVVRERDPG